MLKIQSISDIITNSSSEVFVFKNEDVEDFFKSSCYSADSFHNMDDVKKYVITGDHSGLDTYLGNHPYACDYYDMDSMMNTLKQYHTEDEIWDFFSPIYKDLIGKTIVDMDNNYSDEMMDDLIYYLREKGKLKGNDTKIEHYREGY